MIHDDSCIHIKNLNKTFNVNQKGVSLIQQLLKPGKSKNKIEAIKNFNLDVRRGETVGIIGKNGSGKSTLLKIIIGAINADEGSIVKTKGKIVRLALGMGFDLNLSARDNIYLNGTILGLSFKRIGSIFEEIINFAELENFVDTPIKFFSSGMQSRLAFSIAINANADIYLIDEFFGDVGDEAFKQKSQKAFEENLLKGKTILHVSHSMETIQNSCDRIVLLNNGVGTIYDEPQLALEEYEKIIANQL